LKLTRYIPIVSPESIDIFNELSHEFEYAIIPYYTIIWPRSLKPKLSKKVKWILSSIMPDDLLREKDTHIKFRKLAEELGITHILVWDMPTYLNKPEESLGNTYTSLDRLEYFIDHGFKVIPLIKGAYEDHIRISLGGIRALGFDIAAFHISEYLYTELRPYPELSDPFMSAYDLMVSYIKNILEYDFRQLLLVGAASPNYAYRLMDLDDRICLSGYTWYIDAGEKLLYTEKKNINVKNRFYECTCPYCSVKPPLTRRSSSSIAQHNLYFSNWLINYDIDYPVDVEVRLYDLIADYSHDILIAAGLYVGHRDSIWRGLIHIAKRLKPRYLILMGNTLYIDGFGKGQGEWIKFMERLMELRLNGTITILMKSYGEERPINITRRYKFLFPGEIDPLMDNLRETIYDEALMKLIRLYATAKSKLTIKKYRDSKPLTLTLETRPIEEKDVERTLEELARERESRALEWFITTSINQPHIDTEKMVATPGIWRRTWNTYTKPEEGALYLTRRGEVKIIKGVDIDGAI